MNNTDPAGDQTPGTTQPYVIPPEGSLGLLALGAKGIDLWRKKRDAVKQQHTTDTLPADPTDEKK